MTHTTRARTLPALAIAVVAVWLALGAFAPIDEAQAATCTTSIMNVVAHEDDDLLFQSPDLLHAVQSGQCVRTVFVTAGDAGQGQSYWSGREAGSRAAYAQMAGVVNAWTQADAGIPNHPAPRFTLISAPNISLVFLRLPDGAPGGGGFSLYNKESLQKLWQGNISTIHAVDGSTSYTRSSLIDALTTLMSSFLPSQIRAQDYVGTFGGGDHSDHYASADFARAAHQKYTTAHTFTGYMGYGTANLPANVSGADLTAKQNAFFTYAQFDAFACKSLSACAGTNYPAWLQRQYIVGSESGGTTGDSNVAGKATATASSQDFSTGQTADKAIDGVVDGWPGDYTKEWATVGGRAGSWLKLTWPSPVTLNRIVLHDRPNSDDQATAGTLTFSDGFTLNVGTLPNDGSGLTVTFAARATTSVLFTITGVSSTTINIGLAEIETWGPNGTINQAPVAVAGPDQKVASGSLVQLDGTGSYDPDGNAITYTWIQTGGPLVSLSSPNVAMPTFIAPSGPATLSFNLVVSDGVLNSAPSAVTITVSRKHGPH